MYEAHTENKPLAMKAGTLMKAALAHNCRNIVFESCRAFHRPRCCNVRHLQAVTGAEQRCVEHSGRLECGHSPATHSGAFKEQGHAASVLLEKAALYVEQLSGKHSADKVVNAETLRVLVM